MNTMVSKKYTKALIEALGAKKAIQAIEILYTLSQCCSDTKFQSIINSPTLPKKQKESFVLSVANTKDKKIINFLKLLIQKNRLNIIPSIYDELKNSLNLSKNEYEVIVYSSFKLDSKDLDMIKDRLSSKLGVSLYITEKSMKTEGLRIFIEGMSVEASFLKDRFTSGIRSHILKAF